MLRRKYRKIYISFSVEWKSRLIWKKTERQMVSNITWNLLIILDYVKLSIYQISLNLSEIHGENVGMENLMLFYMKKLKIVFQYTVS